MDNINLKELYEDIILEIWNNSKNIKVFKNPEFEYRKHILLPKFVSKNKLMFIGVNPSFRKGTIIPENEKNIGYYEINKNIDFEDIQYFEKMKELAKYCQTDWTHLDLFFIRETTQKIIEDLSYNEIDFLESQLKISFEIIEKAKPKLIIVSNAFASEFFGKMKLKYINFPRIWKGLDLFFEDDNVRNRKSTFNSEIGTYEIVLNEKKVPILFSGMLSGRRALDIGSYERLKWQSKMILEKLSK